MCHHVRVSLAPPEIIPDISPFEMNQSVSEPALPWITIVWNDPINLMSYVTWVFMTYFKISKEDAEKLMQQVHNEGKSVVSTGTREEMERDVQAMHAYGLWATTRQQE